MLFMAPPVRGSARASMRGGRGEALPKVPPLRGGRILDESGIK